MKHYIKLLRVTNWVKNIFVFVPLVFSKHLFDFDFFVKTLIAFFSFSFAASFVYIINDIYDAEKDFHHPTKKNRPIASGIVSKKQAFNFALFILILLIPLLIISQNNYFIFITLVYLLINFFYSKTLKNIVIVDIFCIAIGFMLRIIGGAVIISVYISSWLILTTLFLSLFLAVMKRRAELSSELSSQKQRVVLEDYSINFIDQISAITGAGVIISYALYTVADRTIIMFGSEYFVITTLFVVFGIFRYMFLVIRKNIGENIVDVLFRDIPMIINIIFYVLVSLIIIYHKIYVN
ncbi:MAG: decaprenyl-phosphate phosphoribosyltransferase [Melioribacteraceae bacterium]|nr:decaprenyl-phosphate phosphoribosyltransferase [Melioribacteraceae bacterium]